MYGRLLVQEEQSYAEHTEHDVPEEVVRTPRPHAVLVQEQYRGNSTLPSHLSPLPTTSSHVSCIDCFTTLALHLSQRSYTSPDPAHFSSLLTYCVCRSRQGFLPRASLISAPLTRYVRAPSSFDRTF